MSNIVPIPKVPIAFRVGTRDDISFMDALQKKNGKALGFMSTKHQPVSLNGVPAYTTDIVGATALSAVLTAPNVVAITFSASVAAATALNVPYEEPAVRNSSGGFVSTSTFPV